MGSLLSLEKKYSAARRNDLRALEQLLDWLARPGEEEPTLSVPAAGEEPVEFTWERPSALEYKMALDVEVNNSARTWNFPKTFTYLMPLSLKGLVQAVMFAEARGMRVKGIGSRYSFSRVAEAGDCYIDMREAHGYRMHRHNETVESLDQSNLDLLKEGEDRDRYFDCPAGLSVEGINYALCPDQPGDRAIFGQRRVFNMGGTDAQQLAGAIATGTHGSGGKYSAFHDMVRSILMVASGGRILRVEPTNGITDPAKHEARYSNVPAIERVELIQDDDRFYSLLVSMGCFGIFHSLILEVAPMVWLHRESRYYKSRWNKHTKTSIARHRLSDKEEEMISMLFNPYKVARRKYQSFLVKIHRPTSRKPTAKREKNKRFWPSVFSNLNITVKLLQTLLNDGDLPKRRLIESSLVSQDDHSGNSGLGYTNIAYRVLQAGAGKLNRIGTGIEFAFPQDKIVAALDDVFDFLEEKGNEARGYYVNGPVALRFVRPSRAFLAPNYERIGDRKVDLWCFLEITRVTSSDADDDQREKELFRELQNRLEARGGRPHWGLNFDFDFTGEKVRRWYPEFDRWKAAFLFFNPDGTFDNHFTKQLGLRGQA